MVLYVLRGVDGARTDLAFRPALPMPLFRDRPAMPGAHNRAKRPRPPPPRQGLPPQQPRGRGPPRRGAQRRQWLSLRPPPVAAGRQHEKGGQARPQQQPHTVSALGGRGGGAGCTARD